MNVSRHYVAFKAAVESTWSAELGTEGVASVNAGSSVGLELSYSYAKEAEEGERREFELVPDLCQVGDPLSTAALRTYTVLIYFIKPVDETEKSRSLRDDWIKRLGDNSYGGDGDESSAINQPIYEKLWDADNNTSRVPHSNPWFIKYVVTNIYPKPTEPAGAL